MTTLYVSDLDWTLLRPDASLSDFSRDTLNGLLDDGLQFTVASARSVVSMRERLQQLRLRLPVIESNGAYISELATGEHLVINAVEGEVATAVYDHIVARDMSPLVLGYDGTADRMFFAAPANEGVAWLLNRRMRARDPRLKQVDNLRATLHYQIVALTVIDRKVAIKELFAGLKSEFGGVLDVHYQENQYAPGWYWLNVHSWRATKAYAIETLREQLGLPAREVVVFGDQANDSHMFAAADRSIAVGNAIPEIKALATQVIGSNADDSVARFIHADYTTRIL